MKMLHLCYNFEYLQILDTEGIHSHLVLDVQLKYSDETYSGF